MTRYRLRLKDGVTLDESEKEKYNVTQSSTKSRYLMFCSHGYGMCLDGSTSYDSDFSKITEHKIDLIPNGLFKKFDIVEVEEDKYNIVCPLTTFVLCLDLVSNKIKWSNNGVVNDTAICKRQFTKEEIESEFKCYANETFMVKNDSK